MEFPHMNIKGTQYELTSEITDLLEQKLAPLSKYIPDSATDLKCDVELQKITEQQSGKIYRAEINLFINGKLFRAEATEEQMEYAIDVVRDDMKRELRKGFDKERSLAKRGGKLIKDMLRFGR